MSLLDNIDTESKLAAYHGEDEVVSGQALLKEIHSTKQPTLHFNSKIPKLDDIIGGFYGTQLVTVSGTSGHGKTTLCQTFTMAALEQSIRPIWFSYEVDTEDFLNQFGTDYLKHIFFPRRLTGRSTHWIEERIWESKLKYGTQVVFIDHLHFLIDMGRHQNVSFEIGQIVRNLKLLAKKHNMIIFLVAHTTKTRPENELGLGDARDSSFIEQESDTVLYVWRDQNDDTKNVLKIAKNRKKGLINKKFPLRYENRRLYEV